MSDLNNWIPCSERLPEPNVKVLTTCRRNNIFGKNVYFLFTGVWIPDKTVLSEDKWSDIDDDCCCEIYDEDTDNYYCKEGWYEETTQGDSDHMSWYMSTDVIAWMPLPEPYRGEQG